MHTYTYAHTYTHTHIHTHTYIHTYIHTHTYNPPSNNLIRSIRAFVDVHAVAAPLAAGTRTVRYLVTEQMGWG